MVSFYKALERARQGGGKPSASVGATLAGERVRFGREMQGLAGRLQPLFDERPFIVLMIMACGRGEGATTVATEFARYLANDARRVLFCGAHDTGVRETGARATGATQEDADGALPILPAGDHMSLLDISEMLGSDSDTHQKTAFREKLLSVRDQFDVVIIDGPPILTHGSWSVLLRHVDGIILVIEAEKTRSAILRSTIRVIEEVGGHVIGIVFNKRRQYIPQILYRLL